MIRVPGKPSWYFTDDGLFRKVVTGSGEKRKTEVQEIIDWSPAVTRYVVGKTTDGSTTRVRYTVQVGEQTHTFSQDDLRDGKAWDNFHRATGQGDKQVCGALADIVRLLGRDLGETLDCPAWLGDQLVMPDPDLMPDGYSRSHSPELLPELLGIAADNPKLALILGFSYGAPYVAPLRRQAFVVHLPGAAGQGKTTGMWASASLWGKPDGEDGIIKSWNATMNGITARLGRLAVLPMYLDDIHAAGFSPERLNTTLFAITEGAGRLRADRNGEEKRTRYWSGILFSSGNTSILGTLSSKAEVARRVLEIPAPIVANGATADAVKAFCALNYGMFEAVPIAAMQSAIEWAERKLTPVLADDITGVNIGIMRSLALGVAGAWHLGGQDLTAPALEAAKTVLLDLVTEANEAGVTTGEKLLEAARQLVIASPLYPTRKERAGLPSDRPRPLIHGFYESPDLFVLTNYIDTIATHAGLTDARVALRELKATGQLVTSAQSKHLRRQFRVAGEVCNVYHLRLSTEEEAADGEGATPSTPYRDAKIGGDSGDSGDMPGQDWYQPSPLPVGAVVTVVTPQVSPSPPSGDAGGDAGGDGVVIPMNARDRQRSHQRADFSEQLGNLRRAFAKAERFPGATEEELVATLRTFSAAMGGLSFAGSPARVGQLLFEKLEAQYPGVPILGTPPKQPVPVDRVVTMFNFLDQGADVAGHRFVVGADVNAQFLAAAQTTALGTGEPVRVSGTGPDWRRTLKLPGYVQLGEDVVIGPGRTVAAGSWIANPMAEYVMQRDGVLPVVDAYRWPESRRWLNLWVKHVRQARESLMARDDVASGMALVAVKLVYAGFLGGWLNSGEDRNNHNKTNTLRPDWMHAVHSVARANKLRALDKAGVQPFATLADAAYFLTNEPPVLSERPGKWNGLVLSEQPGKWKAHRLGIAADQATITINKQPVTTTLAEQVERGSIGNVSKVIRNLHEQHQAAAVTA